MNAFQNIYFKVTLIMLFFHFSPSIGCGTFDMFIKSWRRNEGRMDPGKYSRRHRQLL